MKYVSMQDCPDCENEDDVRPKSNCCGGTMRLPESDICNICGEHSSIYICDTCRGARIINKSYELPKVIENLLKLNQD